MFIIVGASFIYCTIKFINIINIREEVERAKIKIKEDFRSGESLWEKYSKDESALFNIEGLKDKYNEFVSESKRFAELTDGNYKCKIDDFINED